MKNFLQTTMLVAISLAGLKVSAQVSTPTIARYYHRATVQDGSSRVMDQTVANGNISTQPLHGGTNQQWAILPLTITAENGSLVYDGQREYVIASRANGKVVDIADGNNPICYPTFHGGNNQLFKLNYTNTGRIYSISSPLDVNKVLDRNKNTNEIAFWTINSPLSGNQKFDLNPLYPFPYYFSTLQNKNTAGTPLPPAPTSCSSTLVSETAKTFIAEMLIPFSFIGGDQGISLQVVNSPYYKLVHKQYYRLAATNPDVLFLKGNTYTHTYSYTHGATQTTTTEVTTTLDLKFTATGEIEFKLLGRGGKLINSLAASYNKVKKQVTTFSTNFQETEQFSVTITTGSVDRRVATYQLVDYYELYRANDPLPVRTWHVPQRNSVLRIFEADCSGGRIRSEDEQIKSDGNDFGLLELKPASPSTELSKNKSLLYPNSAKDFVTINLEGMESKSVTISVLNGNGQIVLEKHTSATNQTIDISSLPRGLYMVRVVSKQGVTTSRLLKE